MAYQPIQLPDNMGVNAGLDQLNASIDDLAKWKRDQARYKTEQGRLSQQDQRLARMDASQALAEAHALAQKGDIKGAQARLALAGATGLNFQDPDAERQQLQQELGIGQGATAPGGPAAMPGPPSQPQQPPAMGGSAVPDQVDQGRSMQSDPEAEFSVSAKAPPQGGPDPLEALMQKPASAQAPAPGLQPPPFVPPGAEPAAQPPGPGPGPDKVDQLLSQFGQGAPQAPQNELQKALAANNGDLGQAVLSMRNNQQGQRAEQARRLITGKLNGVDISIEPDAERNYASRVAAEDRQRQAGMIAGVLGDPRYDTMLTKLTAVHGPDMASKLVYGLMEKEGADRRRTEDKQEALKQQAELRREGFATSKENSKGMQNAIITAAGLRNQPEARNDTNNRADLAAAEKRALDVLKIADTKTALRQNKALSQALANVATKGPNAVLAHKSAFMKLASFDKNGAAPTDAETKLMLDHLGGIPGAWDQFVKEGKTGDFSDQTLANIAFASQNALTEADAQGRQVLDSLRGVVGPGSGFEAQAPQVNSMVKGYAKLYGINDFPDIYPQASGTGTVLGSGKRPEKPKQSATPSGGGSSHAAIDDFLKSIGH